MDAGLLPTAEGERLQIATGSDDGDLLFGFSVLADGRREVVQLAGPDRRRTVLQSWPDDSETQIGEVADFDGRYLAYAVAQSFSVPDNRQLFVWDSVAGGPPRPIGSVDDDQYAPGPGSMVVHGGKVAWAQGTDEGEWEVHVYDIAQDRERVVHRGHLGRVVRMGDWVVWGESDAPTGPMTLRAIDLTTEEWVELPPQLASVVGPTAYHADDQAFVWVEDFKTLFAWRMGWAEPLLVREVNAGYLQDIHVAQDLVTWSNGTAQWVLDLRTGAAAQLTPEWGGHLSWGSTLVVGLAPAEKTSGSPQIVLDITALPPLGPCPD